MRFLEKDLEDYAEANMGSLSTAILWGGNDCLDVAGRQVPCAFGRIDMLAFHLNTIYVIEFKAIQAGQKELGQVMRYCSTVEYEIDPYKHMNFDSFSNAGQDTHWNIYPVLVAPAFSESMYATNCILIHAMPHQKGFSFSRATYPSISKVIHQQNSKLKQILLPIEKQIAGIGIGNRIKNNLSVFVGN